MSGASPWSIKGVSRADRDLAKQAAKKSGEPIGVWLARRIRESANPGAGGAAPATDPPMSASSPHPDTPSDAGPTGAVGGPPPGVEERRMVVRGLGRRATDVPGFNFGPGQWRHAKDALQAREDERVGEGVAALRDRVRRLESRMDAPSPDDGAVEQRLSSLSTRLSEVLDRLDRLESRFEDDRVSTKVGQLESDLSRLDGFTRRLPQDTNAALEPLERDVRRISDRLQLVEELVLPKAPRKGLLGRLFGRKG